MMSNDAEEEEDGDNPLKALIQDVDATKTIVVVEESSVEINKVEEDEKKNKKNKKKQKQNEGNDDDFEEKDEKEEAERSNMMVVDENGNINEDALILSSSPPTDSIEEVDDLVDEDGKENDGKNSNLHLQNTTTVANQNTNNNNSINYEMQRVKLYKLNAEGYWDDTGTGIVSCEYVDVFSSMGLVVYPEEEGEEEEEEEEDDDDDNDKEKERRERDGEAAAIAGGKDDKEEEEEEKSIQKKRRRRSASATTTTKPTPLLVHKILEEHQHQQEPAYSRSGQSTIISWVEPRESIDLALSFQSIDGCDFIWEQIKKRAKEEFYVHRCR